LHSPPEKTVSDRWEIIVREHAPIVFGAAWRILGHATDAEDVAQEVFLEAFRKWRRWPDNHWLGLLRRLAVCRALDCRRRKTLITNIPWSELPSNAAGPSELVATNELMVLLRSAVDHLPRREAEVFCLRYFENLSPGEIADSLGIKPGAVAAALSKARTKLEPRFRKILQEERP
jgi:RNA polymerase sigma-70 factor, ECF subfamily